MCVEHSNVVRVEHGVRAHDCERADLCLHDEQPVERIRMVIGKRRDRQRVIEDNRQDIESA